MSAGQASTVLPDDLLAEARAALEGRLGCPDVSAPAVLRRIVDLLTPPQPARTPVDDIPVGRENAKLLVAHWENRGAKASVTGRLFREADSISVFNAHHADPDSRGTVPDDFAVSVELITSVEPLHVIPAELAEEIKAWDEGSGSRTSFIILTDVAEALR